MNDKVKITKEEHIFTSEEKLKFLGYGEWIEESDVVVFEYLGYEASVSRVFVREPFAKEEHYFGGHLCGYVKIPKDHPYYGKAYDDIDVDCHAGLTFGEAHEEHWIGYDCAHSGDYVPSTENLKKRMHDVFPIPEQFKKFSIFNPVYRNMQYCIDICVGMIDQLITVSSGATHGNQT